MNIFLISLIAFFPSFVLNAAKTQQQKLEHYCQKYPQEWQGHYNLGRHYYQQENFSLAESSFATSLEKCQKPQLQEAIFYNLGNTYFQQADNMENKEEKIPLLEKSIQNYESALSLNPTAEDTQHNLELAKKELEALKKEQQNQQKNKDQENQNKDQQDKENNSQNKDKEKDQDQQKQSNNQQQNAPQNTNSEQQPKEKQNQPTESNEQKNEKEMQAILQKAKNDEHILPLNFSQDQASFPEENVLKNW